MLQGFPRNLYRPRANCHISNTGAVLLSPGGPQKLEAYSNASGFEGLLDDLATFGVPSEGDQSGWWPLDAEFGRQTLVRMTWPNLGATSLLRAFLH